MPAERTALEEAGGTVGQLALAWPDEEPGAADRDHAEITPDLQGFRWRAARPVEQDRTVQKGKRSADADEMPVNPETDILAQLDARYGAKPMKTA